MKPPSLRDLKGAVDKSADMLPGVSPPALVEYLLAADRYVLDCLTHPYAAPAMCVDARHYTRPLVGDSLRRRHDRQCSAGRYLMD